MQLLLLKCSIKYMLKLFNVIVLSVELETSKRNTLRENANNMTCTVDEMRIVLDIARPI